jgi:hypothetical protein
LYLTPQLALMDGKWKMGDGKALVRGKLPRTQAFRAVLVASTRALFHFPST